MLARTGMSSDSCRMGRVSLWEKLSMFGKAAEESSSRAVEDSLLNHPQQEANRTLPVLRLN